ncbi:MAG: SigE family RNA polymerase sigma factor [Actinobacteria bacterium]|nr:SigE family RNA polymerase sigma factor [Actinomycetota bacterium]
MTGRRDIEYSDYLSARLPSLRRLALLLCHDWQRADDLVQAAIIRVYVKWGRAAAADNTDAYVRAILFREFLHEHRSGWVRLVRLGDELPAEQAAPVGDREAALDLQAAIAALPPRQRATLVLRFYCDQSVEASAQILGCSPGTVKSQTARALSTLRRLLGPDDATGRLAGNQFERGESGPDLDRAAHDDPTHRGVSFDA